MNEASLPAQSSLPPSLPPPSASLPRASVRASLRACTAEGIVAEVVGACFGGAVLTAWSVELGAGPLLLGVLWGLPSFGQILQIPSLWITSRLGRKRAAVLAHALARQVTLPVAALPFLDVPLEAKRAALLGLFTLASVLSVVGHNAWLAWMGELVPSRVRGAYFGRRTALCTVAATLTSLAIATSLDAGRRHAHLGEVLAVVAVARSVAGAITTALMLRQHDPPSCTVPPRVRDFAMPIADRAYRKLLAYRAAWGVATGLGASLSAVVMIRALGLGFLGVALYAAGVAVLRVLTTPSWGRALDRAGGRSTLVVTSLGASLSSLAWVFATPGSAWLIAIDALVSGLLLGGQELAVFTLPLAVAPDGQRPLYTTASVWVGGLAYGVASVAAGAIADVASPRAVLLAAALLRLLATGAAASLDTGVRAAPRSA